jgi:glutamate synthase (ferredoxin)
MTGGIVVVLGKPEEILLLVWVAELLIFWCEKTIRKWFVQYGNGSLRRIRRWRLEKLRRLIKNHSMYTNSPLAGRILEDWETNKNISSK